MPTIGIVHPGTMGSALAAALVSGGHEVTWASAGRSAATRERAEKAGLSDAGTLAELASRSDVVISVCPPSAAVEVAQDLAGFDGLYLDANAVSPATATAVAAIVGDGGARYVDGGVIGLPPRSYGDARLYLSGAEAAQIAALFDSTIFETRVLSDQPTQASALKMSYAAWTKGGSALILAVTQAAQRLGVDDALIEEWKLSQPPAIQRLELAHRQAEEKGWRWAPEMEEIADTLASVGVPDGFHRAAAEVYRENDGRAG